MKKHREYELHKALCDAYNNAVDINDKLIINLRDLSHTMRTLYEGRGSQSRILIIINQTGSITQRELTKRLGIQPGSASEVIAKLENAGFITRMPSEKDHRTTDIKLTEEGKILAEEAAGQRNIRHQKMFSCLSEDDKDMLLTLLERLNVDWAANYGNVREKHGPCEHHKYKHHIK